MRGGGVIQLLIGLDKDVYGSFGRLKTVLDEEKPPHVDIVYLDVGYSTSVRHGGVHACAYGGSLRTVLSFLADSPYVVYLDDDDWLLPDALADRCAAFRQYPEAAWAFSPSYYADGSSGRILCVDEWESTGVGSGIYAERFGGFVRPSGLVLNKLRTAHLLHRWSEALGAAGDGEDRVLFDALRHLPHAVLQRPSVCCALDPKDGNHALRASLIESRIGRVEWAEKEQSTR